MTHHVLEGLEDARAHVAVHDRHLGVVLREDATHASDMDWATLMGLDISLDGPRAGHGDSSRGINELHAVARSVGERYGEEQ